MSLLRAAAARFFAALRAGWAAACERWRADQGAPEVERAHMCWFDAPDTFQLPRSAEDEEVEAWHASHFRQGPWTGLR